MKDTDEKYMKEALKQAKKAYALEETPIGCVIVHEGKLSAGGIIEEIRTRTHWLMRRLRQFEKPAKSWGTGGWRGVLCM